MTFSVYAGSEKQKGNDSEALTNEKIEEYLQQLETDQNKAFDIEFIRTSNLEVSLLKQYGFDGLKLVFSARNSENYYQLGDIPQESPWHFLNGREPAEAIEVIFKPINKKIPLLISQMKDRVRFIYAEKTDQEWRLHYLLDMKLYDGRDYFQVYSGGQPNKKASPNAALLKYKWSLPSDLLEFYSVHDGFGGHDSQFCTEQ